MERPGPIDEELAAGLRRGYGIGAIAAARLPGGEDIGARAWRVDTAAGERWFVKARRTEPYPPSTAVPLLLRDEGVPHVLAPIRSRSGEAAVREGATWLTVYPFVDGRTGTDAGLAERHWRELGDAVRRLHATAVPPGLEDVLSRETYRPAETYRPDAIELVREIDRAAAAAADDPAAGFWRGRRDEILALVEQTQELVCA